MALLRAHNGAPRGEEMQDVTLKVRWLTKKYLICQELAQRLFHFAEPVRTLQHLARLGTVGGAHDAVSFHEIDQVSGASVADAQPPLQQRSGCLAKFDDQAHGVHVKLVML